MSKNAKQNPNKTRNKAPAGSPKPKNKAKTEKPGAVADGKRQVNKPKSETVQQHISETKKPVSLGKENKIENSSSETKMDVQHHPQLDHKPKPWKEYLLEGFMIFIAVMLGFIAENIREDITNSEHVRQLTSQLVQDLKADTINLNKIYAKETQILKRNDTLFKLLQQPLEKADTKKIQEIAAGSHSLWLFHPTAGAMNAIKNELHLKQFSNSKIISYIGKYEEHTELLHIVQDITLQYQRNFLDPFLYQHFTPENLEVAFNDSLVPNANMRNLTQENLTQLGAQMVLIKINNQELLDDNIQLKADASDMLQYVTKQFKLRAE